MRPFSGGFGLKPKVIQRFRRPRKARNGSGMRVFLRTCTLMALGGRGHGVWLFCEGMGSAGSGRGAVRRKFFVSTGRRGGAKANSGSLEFRIVEHDDGIGG